MLLLRRKDLGSKVNPEAIPVAMMPGSAFSARNEMIGVDTDSKPFERLKISPGHVIHFCQLALRVGLPSIFIVFSICYFAIGFLIRQI